MGAGGARVPVVADAAPGSASGWGARRTSNPKIVGSSPTGGAACQLL